MFCRLVEKLIPALHQVEGKWRKTSKHFFVMVLSGLFCLSTRNNVSKSLSMDETELKCIICSVQFFFSLLCRKFHFLVQKWFLFSFDSLLVIILSFAPTASEKLFNQTHIKEILLDSVAATGFLLIFFYSPRRQKL